MFDGRTMDKKVPALQFKVGVGKVIKAWDHALLEMSVGEVAKGAVVGEGLNGGVKLAIGADLAGETQGAIAGQVAGGLGEGGADVGGQAVGIYGRHSALRK